MDSREKRNTFVVQGAHCPSDMKSGVNFTRAREKSYSEIVRYYAVKTGICKAGHSQSPRTNFEIRKTGRFYNPMHGHYFWGSIARGKEKGGKQAGEGRRDGGWRERKWEQKKKERQDRYRAPWNFTNERSQLT